jgi:1-deoxy-D-xylulose-5-phosphate synthase
VHLPVRTFGIPQRFLDHAKRAEILADLGLTAPDLARDISAWVSWFADLTPHDGSMAREKQFS